MTDDPLAMLIEQWRAHNRRDEERLRMLLRGRLDFERFWVEVLVAALMQFAVEVTDYEDGPRTFDEWKLGF